MEKIDELTKNFNDWKSKKEMQLLVLYRKENPTDKDKDKIVAIEKKIEQRSARLDKELVRLYRALETAGNSKEAQDARRQRNHKIYQLGGLVDKAGFGDMEPAALLGMLLQQKEYLGRNAHMLDKWKVDGEKALEQTEPTATESIATSPGSVQQSPSSNTLASVTTS